MQEPIIENPNEYVTVEEAIYDLQAYEPTTGDMDADIDIERQQLADTYFRNCTGYVRKPRGLYNIERII